MTLSPGQLTALRNLARKQAGEAVDWISIADARSLTDLGLAERTREGWSITPAGQTALGAEPAEPKTAGDERNDPVPLR
jgi:hypothetical protein